ncbi:AEC family transporter [Streptomyces tateyamensis]|uniref:AEC family transporter n=1 Tax=Streptomyces tateyamensis TaxID=565073 RepID=A0A2V4NM76_9ACTN|nr:AEC family transporter [Streptomyces tateyamensis]PYC76738.1 AEC family transporter [Streptomyces tateyamensis]
MHAIQPLLSGFAPIWLLTAVGYLIARTDLLGEQAELVLSKFVFHVAMPAALFTMLAKAPLTSFANLSMLAFGAGTLVASLVGWAAARWLFGRGIADQAISSMASGYVNSANLGIPVAVQVLGDASFVGPVLLFQVLLVTPVILTVLDSGTGTADLSARGRLIGTLRLPLRNPVILGSAAGALCSGIGVHLPGPIAHSGEVLGAAGVPTALVTLGMSLHRPRAAAEPVPGRLVGPREVGLAVLTKNLVQPLVAFLVGSALLHLRPHQLLAVVICSALPTAQNVFLYARQYGLNTTLPRNSVLWSTLVSMITLSTIDWALAGH